MLQKYSIDLIEESRLSDGTLYIVDKEIIGNLNFTRDEKK